MNFPNHSTLLPLLLLAIAIGTANAATPAAEADKITNLPGWNGTSFDQYAGYVTVDEAHDRRLFYWFTESSKDPANDPLVLWLNGGPGCSSVGGGLFSELGPFYPVGDGTLKPNPFAWNTVANVIFLESPAGVGFSFSGDPSDYTVGDNRTAWDAHAFLVGFLERYPQYKNTPFWISGESYGGHYVPTLAQVIVEANEASKAAGGPVINFQGFLVGNAWSNAADDNYGALDFWRTHALISTTVFDGVMKHCNLSNIGPLAVGSYGEARLTDFSPDSINDDDMCNAYQNRAQEQLGNINIYDIFADVCSEGPSPPLAAQYARRLDASDNPAGGAAGYDPCIGQKVLAYLDRVDVQKAIHANLTLPWKWGLCSSVLNYSRESLLTSMLPVYKYLMKSGIKMLVYSGDVDAIVPVTGTQTWLAKLDLEIVTDLKPWSVGGQVGGRILEYDHLTFTTIRNAGHMVPYTQPVRALHMFDSWINQKPF